MHLALNQKVPQRVHPDVKVACHRMYRGSAYIQEVPSIEIRENLMRILLATLAATILLIAGQMPASAATAGQALVQTPSYSHANASVEKAGWRHRHWRHRHWRRHHRWHRWWW